MSGLVIGTRGSALALWQARHIEAALLEARPGLEVRLEVIRTKGDKILDTALSKIGDKGLFTKEIENALLAGTVDLAVHSLKDLPTELDEGLTVAAVLSREDPADALVSKGGMSLVELPSKGKVLTGSLRRRSQLLHLRGDLLIEPIRGNVQTRLKKFDQSEACGVIFAKAGLVRLGLGERISERLDPREFLPACGQGALAVEIRKGDRRVAELVEPLDDVRARATTAGERAFLARMGGGCQVPIGAYARIEGEPEVMIITAMVASLDGGQLIRRTARVAFWGTDGAVELGGQLAEEVLGAGAQEILDEV